MTCSDVERGLPEFLDAPDMEFPADFQAHLKSCPSCSVLVADLNLIASEARQLAEAEEPPQRVWVKIAAELRSEGLIREPESDSARPVLVSVSPRRQWRAWWLAPVAAAIVAAGSYVVGHKPDAGVTAKHVPPTPAISQPAVPSATPESKAAVTPVPAPSPAPAPVHQQVARKSAPREQIRGRSIESTPSSDDQQFLSVVSTLSPSMRTTYERQLQAVNGDIRETQAYVNRNPTDMDARQHLMDAYRQKELLYQIALDRIQ
jgi:hypothetical protein